MSTPWTGSLPSVMDHRHGHWDGSARPRARPVQGPFPASAAVTVALAERTPQASTTVYADLITEGVGLPSTGSGDGPVLVALVALVATAASGYGSAMVGHVMQMLWAAPPSTGQLSLRAGFVRVLLGYWPGGPSSVLYPTDPSERFPAMVQTERRWSLRRSLSRNRGGSRS